MDAQQNKKTFSQKLKDFFSSFTLYEIIWFCSIVVLALIFAFIFPEEDTPTQMLEFNSNAFYEVEGSFDELSFDGTVGSFVVDAIYISNEKNDKNEPIWEEYSLIDYTGKYYEHAYSEHTIDPTDSKTLSLKLPISVTKDSLIKLECYADSEEDEDVLNVSIAKNSTVLLNQSIVLEATKADAYTITNNRFLVSAAVITFLYLLDVILNIACELLISKQSKWNFIVSLGVEVVEILVCVVCMYRFATMVTTLLFWIPCDIISFVLWHRHHDEQKEELTVVKKLTWWQDLILIAVIAVWTVGVGYLLTLIEVEGGIFGNNVAYKNIVCYIDACASAVGIANGLLILLRYREQWIAWYIVAILETIINIMAGQWILLILKAGYLTNTTYGYIKWSKYIKSHSGNAPLEAPAA